MDDIKAMEKIEQDDGRNCYGEDQYFTDLYEEATHKEILETDQHSRYWEEDAKTPTVLCENANETNANPPDIGKCVLCLVSPRTHVFVPYGHVCACEKCSQHCIPRAVLFTSNRPCMS